MSLPFIWYRIHALCQDQYVVHSFADMPLNIWGGTLSPNDQALHGCQIAPLTHDPLYALPQVGVFNWHYIQCVLEKFSTLAYQQINISLCRSVPETMMTTRVTLTSTMTETSQILLILLTSGNFPISALGSSGALSRHCDMELWRLCQLKPAICSLVPKFHPSYHSLTVQMHHVTQHSWHEIICLTVTAPVSPWNCFKFLRGSADQDKTCTRHVQEWACNSRFSRTSYVSMAHAFFSR